MFIKKTVDGQTGRPHRDKVSSSRGRPVCYSGPNLTKYSSIVEKFFISALSLNSRQLPSNSSPPRNISYPSIGNYEPRFKNSTNLTRSNKNSYKNVLRELARNLQDILPRRLAKILPRSYKINKHHNKGAGSEEHLCRVLWRIPPIF